MKNILVKSTGKSPFVSFDAETGILEIAGRAIPEDSAAFFEPAGSKNRTNFQNVLFQHQHF